MFLQEFGSMLLLLTWGIYTLVVEKDDWYPKKSTEVPSKYHFAYCFEAYYFAYHILFMIEVFGFNSVIFEKDKETLIQEEKSEIKVLSKSQLPLYEQTEEKLFPNEFDVCKEEK